MPDTSSWVVEVPACQRVDQLVGPTQPGELGHPAAHRVDLRGPVEAQQPADVGRVQPGQALGAWFAQHRCEHDREHQRPQPVERGPSGRVDPLGGVEKARRWQAPAG